MRVGRIPSQVLTSGADGSSGEQGPSGDRKADGNLGKDSGAEGGQLWELTPSS